MSGTMLIILPALAAMAGLIFFSLSIAQGLVVFAIGFLGLLLILVVCIIAAAVSVDKSRPIDSVLPLSRKCCDLIAALLCDFGLLRAEVHGMEKLPRDRTFLIISNHRSAADPMVVARKLKDYNVAFISKPSNMALPILGRMAYGAGFLAIDRENDRNALKTIITASNYVKKGICSMCIYPEGTRSRDGQLLPFHAGSFKIAQKAGAPLVIACSLGTENVARNLKKLKPSKLRLDILETLDAEKVSSMSSGELAEYSRELICTHIEKENCNE